MANSVYNDVVFLGALVDLEKVKALFQEMDKGEPKTLEAQWPPFFIQMPEQLFKDIQIFQVPNSLLISYTTDLVPNPRDLVTIASHFNLRFESTYLEFNNDLYGRCRYRPGGDLLNALMNDPDWTRICFDPVGENFVLDSTEKFNHVADAISAVLKEKLDLMEQSQNRSRGR